MKTIMQKTVLRVKGGNANRLIDSGLTVPPRADYPQWGRHESVTVVRHESSQTLHVDTLVDHNDRRETVQNLSRDKSGQWPGETGWPLPQWVAQNDSISDDLRPLNSCGITDGTKSDRPPL